MRKDLFIMQGYLRCIEKRQTSLSVEQDIWKEDRMCKEKPKNIEAGMDLSLYSKEQEVKAKTYPVRLFCTNCQTKYEDIVEIPFGIRIDEWMEGARVVCTKCGVFSVTASGRQSDQVKPTCSTCGDSGVVDTVPAISGLDTLAERDIPCPDCPKIEVLICTLEYHGNAQILVLQGISPTREEAIEDLKTHSAIHIRHFFLISAERIE